MACATCIVHSGRLVQCDLSYAVCIVNSGTFAMLFMYIVYCGDWLICSLHWLGHNASCDRPDIHTIYKQLQRLYTLPVAIHLCCWDSDQNYQTNFVLRHWKKIAADVSAAGLGGGGVQFL